MPVFLEFCMWCRFTSRPERLAVHLWLAMGLAQTIEVLQILGGSQSSGV